MTEFNGKKMTFLFFNLIITIPLIFFLFEFLHPTVQPMSEKSLKTEEVLAKSYSELFDDFMNRRDGNKKEILDDEVIIKSSDVIYKFSNKTK